MSEHESKTISAQQASASIADFVKSVTEDPTAAHRVGKALREAVKEGRWPEALAELQILGPGTQLAGLKVAIGAGEWDAAFLTTAITAALLEPGWNLARVGAAISPYMVVSVPSCPGGPKTQ